MSKESADKVVAQIKGGGKGDAVANYDNVVEGSKIVKQAVDKFGAVHVSYHKSYVQIPFSKIWSWFDLNFDNYA